MSELNQICRHGGPVAAWPIMSPSGRIVGADVGAIRMPDGSLNWTLKPIIAPGRHAAGPLRGEMPAGAVLAYQGFYAVTGERVRPQRLVSVWHGMEAQIAGFENEHRPEGLVPVFQAGANPALADYIAVCELATGRLYAVIDPSALPSATYRETGDGKAMLADLSQIDQGGRLNYSALGVIELPVASAIGDAVPLSERGLPGPRSRSAIYHATGDGACAYYGPASGLSAAWARLLDESAEEILQGTGRESTQEFRSFDSEPGGAPPDGQSQPQSFAEIESEIYHRQTWEIRAGSGLSANSVFVTPDGRLWNVESVQRGDRDRATVHLARKQRGQSARPELVRAS